MHIYCMYVCVSCYKCIFVFHFCFCFASCFLFGAVLLTWLKLEHNNNTSHYIEILPHTPTQFTHRRTRQTCICIRMVSHSQLETLQRTAYTFVLLLLLLLLRRRCSLRSLKKINKFLFALFTAILHTFHAF